MVGRTHTLAAGILPAQGWERDPEGETTLETLSTAAAFNRWMYQTIAPYLVGPVLEIGSGIGNISVHLLEAGHETSLSDLRLHYCRRLRQRFADQPTCREVIQLDLVHPRFDEVYARYRGRFGTVIALNVVEHIADDHLAVRNCRTLLRPSGRLIILVPAYQWLYNRFDQELGHYRRYSTGRLNELFQVNGLAIERSCYFNLAGILGWFVSGGLLSQKRISPGQMTVYNSLVWLFRLLDRVTFRRIGLSVLAVGRNTQAAVKVPVRHLWAGGSRPGRSA